MGRCLWSREHEEVRGGGGGRYDVIISLSSRDLEEMGYFPGLVLRNAFLGAYARRDMSSESVVFS